MFTVSDAADLLFCLPLLVYAYLLCLGAYNVFGKQRHLPKWVEPLFLVLLGLVIIFSAFGEIMGCHHASCKDQGALTLLLGVLMIVLGIVALLSDSLEVFKFSAAWVVPMVFVILGLLFQAPHPSSSSNSTDPSNSNTSSSHSSSSSAPQPESHDHDFSGFMQQAFTACALASACSRALMFVDPERWGILTCYAISLTSFALAVQGDTIMMTLSTYFMPHTVFLGLCVLAAMLLVPVLYFIHVTTKGELSRPVKDDSCKGY